MVKMMQQKQIWCLKDMFTKRTKYFFTTYTTNFNPCNHILYSVQDQMQIISFTLNNPLQITLKERTPRFMLIIPITCCCLTSLIHSSKLNQTHFLKNGTNDHYCIIYMKEKKEPKATRPMVQSICDYRLPLHACIQDIRGKHCTRITSHNV